MKPKKLTHGGARKGAGRKRENDEPMVQKTIWMPVDIVKSVQAQANKENVSFSKCVSNITRNGLES